MEGFDQKTNIERLDAAGLADLSINTADSRTAASSKGSSVQASDLEKALNQTLAPDEKVSPQSITDSHDHAPKVGPFELHISGLDQVASPKALDIKNVAQVTSFLDSFGSKGDYLNPGHGTNTVIGTGDSDVIRGTGRGFNTITTGSGKDTIILGRETTNRVLDFDPANDRFVISGLNPKNIVIAQGKNPGKGGLNQPLDSVNNALIIDKQTNHILASLPFVKASDISEKNFARDSIQAEKSLSHLKDLGFKTQHGGGQLTGTGGHDRLIGKGDDFLYPGDGSFKIGTATGTGPGEFPFSNDSAGTSELHAELKDGVLHVNGTYKDFNAFPLFSQGEKAIDPNAKILNGSDPVSLINNFLKVPQDVEGHQLSGTHLHFSTAGDDRGNFADATVLRYFSNTPTDAKSGTIAGEFKLNPTEQAAFLAGDLYVNIHTNINGTGDGKSGFPTGENRINFNRDVVKFQ